MSDNRELLQTILEYIQDGDYQLANRKIKDYLDGLNRLSKKELKEQELKKACEIVEQYGRRIGRDLVIVLCEDETVSVAPANWNADVVNDDLYTALKDAEACRHDDY